MRSLTPTVVMMTAMALGMIMCTIAILIALSRPVIDLPVNAIPVTVDSIALIETDFIEEPDQLPGYAALRTFFERQSALAEALDAEKVQVSYALPDGSTEEGVFQPRARQIADLPIPFWFQLGVGVIALLIGAWVFALRRHDWAARMFAVTGVCVPVFAIAAAVYSTRPIALDGDTFRLLSTINHIGAGAFGTALVGIFLMYPKPLVRPVWLLVPAFVFGAVILADALHVAPDGSFPLLTLTQMLIALALGVVQWWRSRREPLDRAGLRWFFLFTLIGCSLFIFLSVAPVALGLSETGLISQGYAFGFFLVMHVGLAFGVTRYRVFELDGWANRIWLWLAAAVLVIAVDLLVLRSMQVQPWTSLSAALLIVGFLYFPLRQMVLGRLFTSRRPSMEGRLPDIMATAFATNDAERDTVWDRTLQDTFDPLGDVERVKGLAGQGTAIEEQGLALAIPAIGPIAARRLRYARQGRRLFSREDVSIADTLVQMASVALESRDSYERGVTVERTRISRDVHDNIGAQLLSALHTQEGPRRNALLRDTLADLRGIINEGFHESHTLGDVLANLRIETADRLEAAAIALDWPIDDTLPEDRLLSLGTVGAIRSILREAISNIIKHSGAAKVTVRLDVEEDALKGHVMDDGRGFDANTATGGNGLENMEARADDAGGSLHLEHTVKGTRIDLALPLSDIRADA